MFSLKCFPGKGWAGAYQRAGEFPREADRGYRQEWVMRFGWKCIGIDEKGRVKLSRSRRKWKERDREMSGRIQRRGHRMRLPPEAAGEEEEAGDAGN